MLDSNNTGISGSILDLWYDAKAKEIKQDENIKLIKNKDINMMILELNASKNYIDNLINSISEEKISISGGIELILWRLKELFNSLSSIKDSIDKAPEANLHEMAKAICRYFESLSTK